LLDTTPLRLDTVTGRTTVINTGLEQSAESWLANAAGQPLVAVSRSKGQETVYWRARIADPWTVISSGSEYLRKSGDLQPLALGADEQLYASSLRANKEQTEALFRFDPVTRRLESEPVVGVQGFDFTGHLIFNHKTRTLLGVRYTSDATDTVWFNADMKSLQANIDKRLVGLINLLDVAECGCSPWVVVTSYSDHQSPIYSLYDRETNQLETIGQSRPKLDARRMATREFVRIQARDGQDMPMYVTRPQGQGPWPTVMLVHGGPQMRGGIWIWDADSQFLASRGYLVVEPEFRGSTGYGDKLFRAGWKQWGLAMQDDVADAARWAIGQGLADARRVCIAGASYGGYATLMGLIRDRDLYRCGVAWAAVTDIGLMFSLHWSDLPETWKRYGMPLLIGDPVKDAAQLEATSPLKQAERVTQPLLLAFGGSDHRVPIEHGARFRDAVRKTNPQVEWVEYPDEGHGWFKPENRYDFWGRVEKFLAKQLAAPQ
jgi:dienelactone hydrolase